MEDGGWWEGETFNAQHSTSKGTTEDDGRRTAACAGQARTRTKESCNPATLSVYSVQSVVSNQKTGVRPRAIRPDSVLRVTDPRSRRSSV